MIAYAEDNNNNCNQSKKIQWHFVNYEPKQQYTTDSSHIEVGYLTLGLIIQSMHSGLRATKTKDSLLKRNAAPQNVFEGESLLGECRGERMPQCFLSYNEFGPTLPLPKDFLKAIQVRNLQVCLTIDKNVFNTTSSSVSARSPPYLLASSFSTDLQNTNIAIPSNQKI